MPLADISLVTDTLLRLLKKRVDPLWKDLCEPSPSSPPAPVVTYSGVSIAQITGDAALNLFLYHAVEDAAFKNQPPVYQDVPPVRFTPMGLLLHYQLTAHAAEQADPQSAVVRAQRLFGLALKTFHDFPCLNRATEIDQSPVFADGLQNTDNVLRITLKNVPANEATSFWTAGTQPVRMAAYYEVSVVLLEPDRPERRAGRVLRYGVNLFLHGAPRLDSSRNSVTFRLLPLGEANDRTVELQPAEAAIGENINFEGTGLTGEVTSLLIKKAGWDEPVEVGSDWGVVTGTDTVFARVQSHAGAQDIVPGLYSAMARVARKKLMSDGSTREFTQSSNEVAFTVAPKITKPKYDTPAKAEGAGIVTVEGEVFPFPINKSKSPDVRVIVGPEPVPIAVNGGLTAGHFEIASATQIRIRFPVPGLNSGDVLPLRIIVNGAENAPRWVKVP